MSDAADPDVLPEALESSLYDVYFAGDTGSRQHDLDALCRQHPEHADALRARVATLTRSDDLFGRVRQQLEAPAPSERIGPFLIRRVLGQGGFGTVYLADQIEPVQRSVALKVLQPGRVDARSLQRFEGERQVLARLQHAGIAKIYDAGETVDGQHYFAMEPIDGKPVTTWCDAVRMDVESRLRLFLQICQAIQHAHQRGVVHRDIKPSNVLVHEEDGRPRPKVIDFGVAKLLAANDTDDASHREVTREGAQVGTPGYMSPEQAVGGSIDTRTDVYALGVLLCELVTGQLPFPRERLHGNFAAMARMLDEEDAKRPSELLRQQPAAAASAAHQRQTTVPGLLRRLSADLDWIVLAAIARQPDDRYASVAALAQDVERHLRREPVSVRERVVSYWLRQFVARHRIGVGVAGAMLLAVVAGIVGLIWALEVVDRARRDAVQSGKQASRQRDAALANGYAVSMTAAQLAMRTGDVRTAVAHLEAAEPARRGWEWRHLAADVDHSLQRVELEVAINDVAWLDDESFLGFEHNGEVGIWSATSGERTRTLAGWSGIYRAFVLDRERGMVVIANNNTVGLWDCRDGRHRRDLLTVAHDVTALAWSADRQLLAVGSRGGRLDFVRLDGASEPIRLAGLDSDVSALVFIDQDEVVVGFVSGEIRRLHTKTGEVRAVLRGHLDLIDDLLLDLDNDVLFSASVDTTVGVWQLSTGQLRVSLQGQVRMRRLGLSPDGRTLYASGGYNDYRLQAWHRDSYQLAGRYHGHESGVTGMSVDPSGRHLLTSSRDRTWRLWPAVPPQSLVRLDAGRDARALSVDAAGQRFATASIGAIAVWDAATLQPALVLDTAEHWVGNALGRETVYVAGPVVAAFAIGSAKRLAEGPTEGHYVEHLAVDPEERWLVGGHVERALVWQLPDLQLRHVLELPFGTGRAIYDARTGCFILGGGDSTLRWLDPARGVVVDELRLDEQDHIVGGIAQHGDLLVAGLFRGLMRWRRAAAPLQSVSTSTLGAAISPDGSRIATCGSDQAVRLWDAHSMHELLVLGGLVYASPDVHFVAGGKRLVALSNRINGPSYVYVWSAPDQVSLPR